MVDDVVVDGRGRLNEWIAWGVASAATAAGGRRAKETRRDLAQLGRAGRACEPRAWEIGRAHV